MATILHLAWRSIMNRRVTTALTIAGIALSMALLLLVERIRTGARDGFTGVISQTDVIAGARSSPVQLVLFSVFQIGNPSNNIRPETWQHFQKHPAVDWTIPFALGDSHKGFRVIATNSDLYARYRYQKDRGLKFREGQPPAADRDVVIGSRIAAELGYKTGDKIILAHGLAVESFAKHDDHPFTVSGILDATGTPFDRNLFITLPAMVLMHGEQEAGHAAESGHEDHDHDEHAAAPGIAAFFIGTKSRTDALGLQREIQTYAGEPLTAALPGMTLAQIWEAMSYAEATLRAVSYLVIIVGLMGMIVALYNSLNERRREMAILRTLGAHPSTITAILLTEAGLLTGAAVIASIALTYGALAVTSGVIAGGLGITLPVTALSAGEWMRLGIMFLTGLGMAALPAWRAYSNALVDGLTIRI